MNTDISDRKDAEAGLKHLNDTLEERVDTRTRQVRELASRLTMAEQEERRRISQVLHDDLQQLLYGLQMKLRMMRQSLESAGQTDLVEVADKSGSWIEKALATTRQLTVDISPPILKHEGLADALVWLQRQMEQLHGLHVTIDADQSFDIPGEDLRVLLFQIVRELLFNIKKHAGVDHAEVELEQVHDEIIIRVRDSGQGFDVAALEQHHGEQENFGLFSVRERLDLLGGRMELDSAPGRGTRVILHAPLRPRWSSESAEA